VHGSSSLDKNSYRFHTSLLGTSSVHSMDCTTRHCCFPHTITRAHIKKVQTWYERFNRDTLQRSALLLSTAPCAVVMHILYKGLMHYWAPPVRHNCPSFSVQLHFK